MNEQSGGFPAKGAIARARQDAFVPATGLREMVLSGPGVAAKPTVDISEIWRVITKWWWLIAGIAVASVLVAVGVSLMMEPLYRAEATIEVANDNAQQNVQVGQNQPLQSQDSEFINTQVGLIYSRSLAERVARGLNLANDPAVVDQSVAGDRSAIATAIVQESINAEVERDTRLIKLEAVHGDQELAAKIANSYAEMLSRSNLERRFEANSYARNFLEQRINTIRSRLEQSERQLVAYAQRQGIVSLNIDTGSGGGSRSEQTVDAQSLTQVNSALQQARTERIAAEQRFLQAQGSGAVTEIIANPIVQQLTQQRAQLQAEYQEKLGTFRPDYPTMVQMRTRIEAIDQAIAEQGRTVSSSLRNEVEAARAREAQLQGRVDNLQSELLDLRERSIQYTILQREVDTNRALYDALLQRYKEVGVAGVGVNLISIIDRAQVPGTPFSPNLPFNLIVGLLAGLVVGFGSAFALEWLDDTIKTPNDVLEKLNIPHLGLIPSSAKGTSIQEELQDRRSHLAEAYQSVRTALQFSTESGIPRTICVTSTRAAEGKSTTALSLAYSMASLGSSVLLIDADLRKPTFRGSSSQAEGLSSLLAGSEELETCIHPTDQENLCLLPAGRIPPNPAELLASGRFALLLQRAMHRFDHVVIDSPPVLGLADAPLIASVCEAAVVVIEAGAIRRPAALNTVNRLRAVDANILGGILTKFNATKSGYGYGYGYGYGDDAYAYREGDEPKRQIELLKGA